MVWSNNEYTCKACNGNITFTETFLSFIVLPACDLLNWLQNWHTKEIVQSCISCHVQNTQYVSTKLQEYPKILMVQVSRFSVSNVHNRNRKNMQSFTLYEKVKFGLIEYGLFGVIEHHGSYMESGHYTCFVKFDNCWFGCNNTSVYKATLPNYSQNCYLLFYKKSRS